MEDDENFEVDPAIAAAMGFSGFGSKPKKRKYNDYFVDPSITNAASATGANGVPTREKPKKADEVQSLPHSAEKADENGVGDVPADRTPSSLAQLRHGVRNQNGDIAYFLPSFIEDPWARLKAK